MAKSVLIVDDAVFMRMKLKDILEKNGYEVAGEAQNGQEAFEKYQATKPDLVTMDITMPEVDGLEALKMIKDSDANAKVVMCSAMGQQGMVMDAIRAGAVDFIVKPFDTERVIQAIDKALS
ncbi:response regulator [Ligilactobacillus agilis]|uniref:Regulator of chemotaxis and motility n=1 Tax=Ligilactobacillus agilis TaxID=1601 RepID=A0A6F9Y3I9_9LACO|nr:response regulator [Ligilactobacillus agilis]GET12123.1 regulator of chemotaxis and motility [Ligilactobacillus agilis]GET16115.1 regulator of chemotaxis and motility [Ligilactobacillus agilis]